MTIILIKIITNEFKNEHSSMFNNIENDDSEYELFILKLIKANFVNN